MNPICASSSFCVPNRSAPARAMIDSGTPSSIASARTSLSRSRPDGRRSTALSLYFANDPIVNSLRVPAPTTRQLNDLARNTAPLSGAAASRLTIGSRASGPFGSARRAQNVVGSQLLNHRLEVTRQVIVGWREIEADDGHIAVTRDRFGILFIRRIAVTA